MLHITCAEMLFNLHVVLTAAAADWMKGHGRAVMLLRADGGRYENREDGDGEGAYSLQPIWRCVSAPWVYGLPRSSEQFSGLAAFCSLTMPLRASGEAALQ